MKCKFRKFSVDMSVVWNHSLPLMNSFNKAEAMFPKVGRSSNKLKGNYFEVEGFVKIEEKFLQVVWGNIQVSLCLEHPS